VIALLKGVYYIFIYIALYSEFRIPNYILVGSRIKRYNLFIHLEFNPEPELQIDR